MNEAGAQEGYPVGRPARPGSYVLVAANQRAASEWKQMCNQLPGAMQVIYDRLTSEPDSVVPGRQDKLAGSKVALTMYKGEDHRRWQIDVGSGGRLFYIIDKTPQGAGKRLISGTVVIQAVSAGHPKSTERKPSEKRRPGRK